MLALLLLALARSSGLTQSGRIWAVAKLFEGLGFYAVSWRGQAPEWLTVAAADSVVLVGFMLEFVAAAQYLRLPIGRVPVLGLALVALAVFWSALLADAAALQRIAVFTTISALVLGGSGVAFMTRWGTLTLLGRVFGMAYVAIGLAALVRAGHAVTSTGVAPIANSLPQVLSVCALMLFMLVNGFGFLLLTQEDTNRQLMRSRERLMHARRMTRIASVEMDLVQGLPLWSSGLPELLGFPPGQGPVDWDGYRALIPPEDRARSMTRW